MGSLRSQRKDIRFIEGMFIQKSVPVKEPYNKPITEEALPLGTQVSFEEDNNLIFGQDLSWWQNVPSDVTFTVDGYMTEKSKITGVWLRASGYGGKPYGNGRILVYTHQEGFRKNGPKEKT
jgi:hypothetical protein